MCFKCYCIVLVYDVCNTQFSFSLISLGPCAVHLIGDGISVGNGTAAVTFVGTRDVTSFRCRVDQIISLCRSPVRYTGLSPGVHRMIVVPLGCKFKTGGKISEKFVI